MARMLALYATTDLDELDNDVRAAIYDWTTQPPELSEKLFIRLELLPYDDRSEKLIDIIKRIESYEPQNQEVYLLHIKTLANMELYGDILAVVSRILALGIGRKPTATSFGPVKLLDLIYGGLLVGVLSPICKVGICPSTLKDFLVYGYTMLAAYWGYRTGSHVLNAEYSSKAIELIPHSALLYRNRAAAYIELGHYEHALEDLSIASNLEPNHIYLHLRRWKLYTYQGKHNDAIQSIIQAISINPVENSYFELGLSLLCNGQIDAAKDAYKIGMHLEPESQEIQRAVVLLERIPKGCDDCSVIMAIKQILQVPGYRGLDNWEVQLYHQVSDQIKTLGSRLQDLVKKQARI